MFYIFYHHIKENKSHLKTMEHVTWKRQCFDVNHLIKEQKTLRIIILLWLLTSLSLCVCVSVCPCMWTCFKARGQHQVFSSMGFAHYVWRQGLSVDLELSDLAMLASQAQELHLRLPNTEITSDCFHPPLFVWVLEILTQDLTLGWKATY